MIIERLGLIGVATAVKIPQEGPRGSLVVQNNKLGMMGDEFTSIPIWAPAPELVLFKNSGQWTVPPHVYSLDLIVGGAGGGGGWNENNLKETRKGGGGGISTAKLEVEPGQLLSFAVGTGGGGRPYPPYIPNVLRAYPGGASSVTFGGVTVLSATGGGGGCTTASCREKPPFEPLTPAINQHGAGGVGNYAIGERGFGTDDNNSASIDTPFGTLRAGNGGYGRNLSEARGEDGFVAILFGLPEED